MPFNPNQPVVEPQFQPLPPGLDGHVLPAVHYLDDFSSMNNVQRVSLLRVIQNMRVTTDKRLVKRPGYRLWCPLPGAHSLWYDRDYDLKYLVAKGPGGGDALYRVSSDAEVELLAPVGGIGAPMWFERVDDRIFCSSRMWNGVIEYGAVRPWGKPYTDDPADLAESLNSEEQLFLNSSGPPPMENLCRTGGRIFGSVGRRVYYNDPPLAYECYTPDSFIDFDDDIVMIAFTAKNGMYTREGMFFASEEKTWFATGFDPEQWELKVVGKGAVPGTLQYIPDFKEFNNIPVWLTKWGVHAGVNGIIQQVTQDRVRFDTAGRAASYFRLEEGGQYLASFVQPADVGFGDRVTCDVVRNGKIV